MPSIERRSSARGRPVRAGCGSNGWMNARCLSVRCTVATQPCYGICSAFWNRFYNPLAGGMLTGRYRKGQAVEAGTRFGLNYNGPVYQRRYWTDPIFDVVTELGEAFTARGKALNHVALAWTLAQPGITAAIIGASRHPR